MKTLQRRPIRLIRRKYAQLSLLGIVTTSFDNQSYLMVVTLTRRKQWQLGLPVVISGNQANGAQLRPIRLMGHNYAQLGLSVVTTPNQANQRKNQLLSLTRHNYPWYRLAVEKSTSYRSEGAFTTSAPQLSSLLGVTRNKVLSLQLVIQNPLQLQLVIKVIDYQQLLELSDFQQINKVIDFQGDRGKLVQTNLFCNALIINKLDLLQRQIVIEKVPRTELEKLKLVGPKIRYNSLILTRAYNLGQAPQKQKPKLGKTKILEFSTRAPVKNHLILFSAFLKIAVSKS